MPNSIASSCWRVSDGCNAISVRDAPPPRRSRRRGRAVAGARWSVDARQASEGIG